MLRHADASDTSAISATLLEAFAEFEALYTPAAYRATTPTSDQIRARMAEGPVWAAEHDGLVVGTGRPPGEKGSPSACCTRSRASQPRGTMAKELAGAQRWEMRVRTTGPLPLALCLAAALGCESTTSRAAGFAGCNRFSASYRLSGDSLSFGPIVSKMACADGDELERSFLTALPSGPGGVLARFRAR
jgi:hypothetical protein